MVKSRLSYAAIVALVAALAFGWAREAARTDAQAGEAASGKRGGSKGLAAFPGLVDTREGLRLTKPGLEGADIGPPMREEAGSGPFFAMAFQYQTPVFDRAAKGAQYIASVRRGTQLRAAKRVRGTGCAKGAWYALAQGGFICTQEGFSVTSTPQKFWIRQPKFDANKALSFKYAKVNKGALRFHRIPSEEEVTQIKAALEAQEQEQPPPLPDVVQMRVDGDYFVALDRIEHANTGKYYRTVRGRYVRVHDLTPPKHPPKLRGEVLTRAMHLPLAFVYGEDEAPLLRKQAGELRQVGVAEVHSRFPLQGIESLGSEAYALGPSRFAVPLARVRIARRIERPAGVGAKERWVHVNLSEQTLVAYEGDKPRFATLVSTGKEETGHGTPTGLYYVREKHLSVTMSGSDPVDGRYEVAEVPWTQFYHDGYALHGAYWHNSFGVMRSHGCTNLSPPDARWLFRFTSPQLKLPFHSLRRAKGTAVYISRDPSDQTLSNGPS